MALFKINKGLNANLPEPRHDGYAYFTTDDGKFWIDFEDNVNGVTQQDGTKVDRKALNAERADYVGYKLTLLLDGETPNWGDGANTYNGLVARSWNITPESINAFDIIDGSVVSGEAIFNNVVYLNDDTYADHLTAENAIITGALRVVGDLNGSTINASSFVGNLTGTASNAAKTTGALTLKINNTVLSPTFNGNADTTITISTSDILDGILYAGSSTQGGPATSANKLIDAVDAGDSTHPVYFDNGIPVQVSGTQAINVASADKVNNTLTLLLDGNNFTNNIYDGSNECNWNITPESINAVRRDGDTIPGPLTINGVLTINNDAYIDSATIGDLLVNGGTRFVGDVNAGQITASNFIGDLTGNASTATAATKANRVTMAGSVVFYEDNVGTFGNTYELLWDNTNGILTAPEVKSYITVGQRTNTTLGEGATIEGYDNIGSGQYSHVEGTENRATQRAAHAEGFSNKASGYNSHAEGFGTTADGNNAHAEGQATKASGYCSHAEGLQTTARRAAQHVFGTHNIADVAGDSSTKGTYVEIVGNGAPSAYSNARTLDWSGNEWLAGSLTATSLIGSLNNSITLLLDGETPEVQTFGSNIFNNNASLTWNITPQSINAFDILDGSTVSGEAIFNNAVYLNDETYADSLTVGNEIITGALRVVGDINGSTINATTFVGNLTGTASNAAKTTGALTLKAGTQVLSPTFDGHQNETITITLSDLGGLSDTTTYAASPSIGGSASTALALVATNGDANSAYSVGGSAQPVYFANGIPVAITGTINNNAATADKVNNSLTLLFDGDNFANNIYDGSDECNWDITPENINAIRRDGDTIPGYLTLNNVLTVNNDAYIDSATIGDLLVNGGTRFVGAVNAETMTASQFIGPLQGTASNAAQTTGSLYLDLNGQVQSTLTFNGSADKTWRINPSTVGAVDLDGDTMTGSLTFSNADIGIRRPGRAGSWWEGRDKALIASTSMTGYNAIISTKTTSGSWEMGAYNYDTSWDDKLVFSYVPDTSYNGQTNDGTIQEILFYPNGQIEANGFIGNASSANKVNNKLTLLLDGETPDWGSGVNTFDGEYERSWNITPQSINAFDVIDGSVVSGEAIFNNVVYLNDDTYADSLTAENAIITGALRVVGDINGSTINATTFVGNLTGTASNAAKTTGALTLKINNTVLSPTFNGNADTTITISTSDILDGILYAGSSTQGGAATSAEKLVNNTDAGDSTHPVYFANGIPVQVSGTQAINVASADKVNETLTILLDGELPSTWASGSNVFDGSAERNWNITPEAISAIRRDGDTIPGPLTLNGVFTVNNDAYIDSATIGDLLVNGGTRFVGAINAGNITATQFTGPLQGTASNAAQTTGTLTLTLNSQHFTNNTFNGSVDRTWNITASSIGALPDSTLYAGSTTVGGSANHALKLVQTNNGSDYNVGSTTQAVYFENGIPKAASGVLSNTVAKANETAGTLTLLFDGDSFENNTFNGSTDRNWSITPQLIHAFDVLDGDTVYGPAIFNNTLTVNNDAYIDSATIGDLLVNGGTRFVGDVNAGTINANSFVGDLTGTASNAAQTTGNLYLKLNNEYQATLTFNGSTDKTWDIQPSTVGAAPAVNGVYYGTCDTAQTTKAKEVILVNGTGFELVTGAMIAVKFTNASAAATMTLKVGTDAASAAAAVGKNLYRYGTTAMSSGAGTTGWRDGAVVLFVYDATADSNNGGWFRTHWENNTYTLPTVTNIDCETDADAAAKEITNGAWLDERDGNIQEVTMRYANTYAGSLTFNSRPLYINGHPSSATNYTLPAGKYMVYYNGDYYCFNTNGHYAGKDFIHSINVGSSSIGTAGVYTYYKFASFAITGANEVASTIVRYRATYKVNSVYPAYNQNNGYTFTVDFTLNTDASNNILITSINCSYNGAMPYSNYCYYAVASDNKTLELYWASYATYHYLANIELLTVDKILLAGDTIPECVAYISGTGYELTFLYLNDVTTNSVTVGTPNMINNYAYSRYAVNSYYLYQYAAPANNTTTKYFLCGGGQSATSTTYSTINSQANYSPDVYLLNRELYAPLHVNKLYGTSDVTYGGTLPSSPTTGQIFFQTGGSSTSGGLGLPTGGATGQQLYKNSSADGDCVWSNPNVANTTATTVYVTGCTSTTSKQQYHSNIYMNCSTGVLMGAAWNDYAEYRESDVIEPGRCIIENGDDTLSLSNERMLPGAEIVSDTFGFAIGKTGKCQTPVAASGRVLAYPYEDRNEFKPGMPVCSGPNGTVSIMTKEEARENPWCIIGTVSAVPNYDTWGEANVKVNGRIWIRIR